VLWKLKLITIHCLGLLAVRVTLNQECLNLINDFLALNHFKIRIDCYTIKPHDVINILKSTDKNIRLSGYFILHHCTLVKGDSNWPDVVTLIWNNIDDFNTPYYGHLLEKAATKLETFRENFVADIKRQLNAKKMPPRSYSSDQKSNTNNLSTAGIYAPNITTPPPRNPLDYTGYSYPTGGIGAKEGVESTQKKDAGPTKPFNQYPTVNNPTPTKPTVNTPAPTKPTVNTPAGSTVQPNKPPNQYPTVNNPTPTKPTVNTPAPTKPTVNNPATNQRQDIGSNMPNNQASKVNIPAGSSYGGTRGTTRSTSAIGTKPDYGSKTGSSRTGESAEVILGQIREIVFEKEFSDIKKIDSGSFGVVYSAIWRNRQVAVKKIVNVSLTTLGIRTLRQVKTELDILNKMRSDRTLKLEDTFRDQESLYLITQFYPKRSLYHLLYEAIDEDDFLNRHLFFILAKDICEGLNYLHYFQPQILHLDLKPKNILIDGNNELRAVIADFGLAVMKSESKSAIALTARGTAPYMAPDFYTGKASEKTDIFSVAIILWEMLNSEEPYRSQHIPIEGLTDFVRGGARPQWTDRRELPDELKNLVEECWSGDPSVRPTANELYHKLDVLDSSIDF
jgi:hypothetical protein